MSKVLDMLLGCAVGDALGVPYEFKKRGSFKCESMVGYGSHNQPAGTWSDDTSMTFCLASQIAEGLDLYDLSKKFLSWFEKGEYTANGDVFDIGIATQEALKRLKAGCVPESAGGDGFYENGNGSLMRISPLVFLCAKKTEEERFLLCKKVSSITHQHEI